MSSVHLGTEAEDGVDRIGGFEVRPLLKPTVDARKIGIHSLGCEVVGANLREKPSEEVL